MFLFDPYGTTPVPSATLVNKRHGIRSVETGRSKKSSRYSCNILHCPHPDLGVLIPAETAHDRLHYQNEVIEDG